MTKAGARTRRVVVDTDTGIDDAMALLYLAGRPDVELVALTAVYGNTSVDNAVTNIARVQQLAGLQDVPVARGAAGPVGRRPRIAHHVHGHDGLGDVLTGTATPEHLLDVTAADLLVDLARSQPGELDLLMLGPLTNLGLALQAEPDLLTMFGSVVVMGGSGPYPPLGTVWMADPNIANDTDAATRVLAAPRRRLVSVGVDVTIQAILDEQAVERLAGGGPWGRFSAQVLQRYLDFYQLTWGRRVSPAHDGLAAGLLLEPGWATTTSGPVVVTDDGFSARAHLQRTHEGNPVAWPVDETPETEVVTAVDAAAFIEDFVSVIAAGGTGRA